MKTIYLDHHATTPLDPRAYKAMLPYFCDEYGNASSQTHEWGHRAADAVAVARASVAQLLGAKPEEIIFTAGSTESNNLAIKGIARLKAKQNLGNHLITTAIEHKAVLMSMKDLQEEGFELTVLQPNQHGIVTRDMVEKALRPNTILVSVMAANSEIGTIQPVQAIGELCRQKNITFHTDATQIVGKLPLDVKTSPCDLLSLSAHKFYGPKGVGALYIREGVELQPLFSGGGQEGGLRSGTLNVPGIVGMGVVARACQGEMEEEARNMRALRDWFWQEIQQRIPDAVLNGCSEQRLPGNLNVAFPRCESGAIMAELSEFALSTGSACQSGKNTPSEVLTSIGCPADLALSSVRFGLGKSTTKESLTKLADQLEKVVKRLRETAAV
ncbi:MAG: cysteine desulfurase [Candidatus Eisenbacteria bacterium]|uniref:cysteine desulfurase n=1 Tax=Eiseniibacteriota bacterium TaxID=2212470 RepID=A0A7Y2EHG5_UNCEI|nr:cysteine desulfurase [Candidatus Eisenbacteria bacterium]